MESNNKGSNKLERGYSLYKDKSKSLLFFINTFATLSIIFFLCIFLPYATLFGNAADLVKDWNKELLNHGMISFNAERSYNDSSLKFIQPSAQNPLTIFQENCIYDITDIRNTIKDKKDKFNMNRFSKFEEIDKRLTEIKAPFIDKIPISAKEAIIYFPILIPIFISIYLIRLFEVFNLRDELIKFDNNDSFGIKSYAKIPLIYILTLLFLINLIYILCLMALFPKHYSNNQCNLLQIL
ncbi:hypothetical protein, partial [Nodularia spumigena]|uniref:hypothetical protein n=1 Tax=Nodularia spumigena TaxID=70799 RepID=UPI0012905854